MTVAILLVSLTDNVGHHNSRPVSDTQPVAPVLDIVAALCHLYAMSLPVRRCLMILHHGQRQADEAVGAPVVLNQIGGKEQGEVCLLVLSLQSCLRGHHQA